MSESENKGEGVLFLGSKSQGLRVLKLLHRADTASLKGAVTIDDQADSRSAHGEIQTFCRENGIPLWTVASRSEAEQRVRDVQPSLCFVSGWYWLFSREILEYPDRGFAGIHNSLLPRYRGGAPLVWALIHGEEEVGSSIFQFTPGMDDGPIWSQVRVPVSPVASVGEVAAQLEDAVLAELARIFPSMIAGELKRKPQKESGATYCAQRNAGDGEIKWALPASRIHNFVRAQSRPYPGAFSWFRDLRIRIWRARPFDGLYDGSPGQVIRSSGGETWITCGERTALIVEELQIESEGGDAPVTRLPLHGRLGGSPG